MEYKFLSALFADSSIGTPSHDTPAVWAEEPKNRRIKRYVRLRLRSTEKEPLLVGAEFYAAYARQVSRSAKDN